MKDAASHAMDTVRRMIEKNLGSREPFKGIPIETCLEVWTNDRRPKIKITCIDRLGKCP